MLFVSRYPRTLEPDLEKKWRASERDVKKQESRRAWAAYHGKCLIETLPRCYRQPFWRQDLLSSNIEELDSLVSNVKRISIGIVAFREVEWVSKSMNWAHGMRFAGWVSHSAIWSSCVKSRSEFVKSPFCVFMCFCWDCGILFRLRRPQCPAGMVLV